MKQQVFKNGLLSTLFLFAICNAYANSIQSRGMGDTGVANDASNNPALYGYAKFRFVVLGGVADKDVGGYNASDIGSAPGAVAPGHHTSDTLYGFIPKFTYGTPIKNHPNVGWGIAMDGFDYSTSYGNFSGSTIGKGTSVFGGGPASLLFKRLVIPISIGWSVVPNFAVGASLIPVIQTIDVGGFSPFAAGSINPANFTNRGRQSQFGIGVNFGASLKLTPKISIGAIYQPLIHMSKQARYSGLFSNNGSFNIAPSAVAGIAVTPSDKWVINADVQKLWNSAVNALSDNNFCTPGIICTGIPNGAGFGRLNVVTYKLGVQWTQSERWTWRAGFEHSTAPFPSTQTNFNIVAPRPIAGDLYTIGFSRILSHAFALHTSFKYGPTESISGASHSNPLQTIRVFQTYYELGAAVSWRPDA